MVQSFTDAPKISVTNDSLAALLSNRTLAFFVILTPFLAVLAIVAYGVNVLQVGVLFTAKPLAPKPDRFNLANGIKRIISVRSLVQLVRDVAKLLLIGFVGYRAISANLDTFYRLSDTSPDVIAGAIGRMALTTTLQIGGVILLLALFDYAYQKYDFEKNIRMSKQDVREEMKDTEGNPQIKARVRQLQREMSRKRMMREIPEADVVVTNPTHIAVALKYNPELMEAPLVVAKGQRLIAEKIKEIAKMAGVPIVENKPLARALYKMCDIGSRVPSDLYRAVAEVLAYVYRLKGHEVQ
jgi:flagellar biosynthetic protein FlhB